MNFFLHFELFRIDKGAWCWLYFSPKRPSISSSESLLSSLRTVPQFTEASCRARQYNSIVKCVNIGAYLQISTKHFFLVSFFLEHQHLHVNNDPQKSLLKLKIFKIYDKTKVHVLFTVPPTNNCLFPGIKHTKPDKVWYRQKAEVFKLLSAKTILAITAD